MVEKRKFSCFSYIGHLLELHAAHAPLIIQFIMLVVYFVNSRTEAEKLAALMATFSAGNLQTISRLMQTDGLCEAQGVF